VKMLSGFKEFILRGNIVELAVGVVIGVAFNDLVTTFTKGLIQPLIGLVSGGKELSGTIVFHNQDFQWAAVVKRGRQLRQSWRPSSTSSSSRR